MPILEELSVPASIETVIANFDTQAATFDCTDVSSALGVARQALGTPSVAENRGAWAENLAFALAGSDHHEKPWDTWFGPMGSTTAADGSVRYFPDATEADANIVAHWKVRATSCKASVLVARYADLVWDMSMLIAREKRDRFYAYKAIDAYLASAGTRGRDPYQAFPEVERALTLAIQIGDADRRDAARKLLLKLHKAAMLSGGQWWQAPNFIERQAKAAMTDEERDSLVSDLESVLKRSADVSAPNTFNPHDAERAAQLLAPYYRTAGDGAALTQLHVSVAKAFEQMGAMSDPMLAAMVYQTSADAYRQADLRVDAERVQRLVEVSNLAAVEQMKPQEFTMEVSKEEVEAVLSELVQGSLDDTLRRLAINFMVRRTPIEEFLAQAAKDFPLSTMIPQAMMQGDRVVAAIGPLDDDANGHLILQSSRHLTLNNGWLTWAFDRSREVHSWSATSIGSWANRSGLFENPSLLEAGLSAWLADDHIAAVHILVPQVESAFRNLARRLGRPTTEPHRYMKRARSAKTFGALLSDAETVAALGPNGQDLELHMRALFTDPRGHNLRNELSHGLLAAGNITAKTSLLVIHAILLLGVWLKPTD